MLSIIIASASPVLLQQVKQNIAATVGVPHEVLAFENEGGGRGICEIYNEGIARARYDLLCFMHEDILFETSGWGAVVAEVFDNHRSAGVLGIAGTTYKSFSPGGWFVYSSLPTEYSQLIQEFKYKEQAPIRHYKNPDNQKLPKVACVDGVWFCVKKTVAAAVGFDAENFKRFHCYDLDFSLAVGRQHDNFVTFDVLLRHYSEGKFDGDWLKEILLLHKKWGGQLPAYTKPYSPKQIYQTEKQHFRYFLKQLIDFGLPGALALRFLWHKNRLLKFSPKLFVKFHVALFKHLVLKKKIVL